MATATKKMVPVKTAPALESDVVVIDGRHDRALLREIAIGALRGAVAFITGQIEASRPPLLAPKPTDSAHEIMTADEVAAFLGVDRNTVYDYAGRGVIPHQRLGKRILFR